MGDNLVPNRQLIKKDQATNLPESLGPGCACKKSSKNLRAALLVVKFLCSFNFSVVQLYDKDIKSQIYEKERPLGHTVTGFLFTCAAFISASLGLL